MIVNDKFSFLLYYHQGEIILEGLEVIENSRLIDDLLDQCLCW